MSGPVNDYCVINRIVLSLRILSLHELVSALQLKIYNAIPRLVSHRRKIKLKQIPQNKFYHDYRNTTQYL